MDVVEKKITAIEPWPSADSHGNLTYTIKWEGGEGWFTTKNENTYFKVGEVAKFTTEPKKTSKGKDYLKVRVYNERDVLGGNASGYRHREITKEEVSKRVASYVVDLVLADIAEWKNFETTLHALSSEIWKQIETESTEDGKDTCIFAMSLAVKAKVAEKQKRDSNLQCEADKKNDVSLVVLYRNILGAIKQVSK